MAIETVRLNVPANPVYTASFSFNFADFLSRQHVFPDRVYFDATGTGEISAPAIATSAPFSAWHENYTAAEWQLQKTVNTNPSVFLYSLQVEQQPDNSVMPTPAETFFVSRMKFGGNNDLVLDAYSSPASFLSSPLAGYPKNISASANASKPHALIISKSRLYFFWLDSSDRMRTNSFNGSSFSGEQVVADTGIYPSIGVSGCLIKTNGDEYVAVAYARSTTEIAIATFRDGFFPTTATHSVTLGIADIDSRKVAISQNPRTGKIYLSWIKNSRARYKTFDFAAPGVFSNESATQEFSGSLETTFGLSIRGLENFETSFAMPKIQATSNNIENSLLRGSTTSVHGLTPPTGYAVQFPFSISGEKFLGLVTLSAFTRFDFYRRPLHFPAKSGWNKASKMLYLQGPPWPGTQIGAEVDFGEVATTTSLAHAVNAAGGRKAFNGSSGIIASASTLYTIKFDRDMEVGSFPLLISSGRIKLLRPDNSSVPLSYQSGSAREINFTTSGTDLLFSTVYRITVASDAVDANGSQIWEAATMSFTTQSITSTALASEVSAISAYSDAARTDSIADNGEVNFSKTIYLRMTSKDPAFNTLDSASLTVWRNGTQIATIVMNQEAAASDYFYGQYSIAAPLASDSLYEFRTPNSSILHRIRVDYPTFAPVAPASGAINVPIASTIRVKASEAISSAEIDATTVSLTLEGVPVAASRSYNAASREITITPDAPMQSEKTYQVTISGLKDAFNNQQNTDLTYTFTIADVIPPTIVLPTAPVDGETGVTIDRRLLINFSEAILAASASPATVKLKRGAATASYSVSVSGNQMTIDPDDAPDGGLRVQTSYTLEIGPQ